MAQPRIDWRSLSYRPGDTLQAVIVVADAAHPPRSITWTVYHNAIPISSGTGDQVLVHGAAHGVYKVEALLDFAGSVSTLRSAVSVSGGTEAKAVLPPPVFNGSMIHLGSVFSVELKGQAATVASAPAQLAGLTQVVYLLPGTTHISFALDPEQAATDGDVVVRTRAGNWALFGGERLSTQDLGFGYRVDPEEPVPAPKDLKLQLTTEVYHVTGSSHGPFSVRAKVNCWRSSPQLYRYEACPYVVHPGGPAGGRGVRLAVFFQELEVVEPGSETAIVYSIPRALSIPEIRMASSGLPSRADRATGLGFTESNRGVVYESLDRPDLDAFSVAGIPGFRPGILSVQRGGLEPVVPRIRRLRGQLLLYASGAPLFAGTLVKVEIETGKARVLVGVPVTTLTFAAQADTFALAGSVPIDLSDFQFGQTGLVTHFTLDETLAQPPAGATGTVDLGLGAPHIYTTVLAEALNFEGVCYIKPEARRLVDDLEAIASPVTEVLGCHDTVCGPQGLYCYTNGDVQPTVTVTASDPNASEAGDPGQFTFTRIGAATDTPLSVFFTVSGSAMAGVDYQYLGTYVVFAPGVSSVTKQVLGVSDSLSETTESITLMLSTNAGYLLGSPSVATVYLTDSTPLITVTSTGTAATEAGATANFTFQRTGSTSAALTVNFTVGGTATSGTDYTAIGTSVTFPIGQATALKTVSPLPDALVEGAETVVLAVAAGTGYALGNPSAATIYITDTTPVVTVAATTPNASETTNGVFTFTRTGPTTAALTAFFTLGGTATNISDYADLGTSVTFAIGQATALKTLVPVQDIVVEGSETAILTLAAGAGYAVGTPSIATVYILDDDAPAPTQPVVTVVATDDHATEWNDPGTFTFTRTGSTASVLSVNFTLAAGAGQATPGTDYNPLLSPVVFAAGSSTATRTVNAIADAAAEGPETVDLTLAAGTGYEVGAPSRAVVYIEDVKPVITVVATDPTANEAPGDTGTFTFSRTGPATFAVTAYFTVGGTATAGADYTALPASVTFGVGQSTATLTVTPLADAVIEGVETVIVTLDAAFGYVNGIPSSATVAINEPVEDLVYIHVIATGSQVAESGNPGPGTIWFYCTNGAGDTLEVSSDLTVQFEVTGTAKPRVDYEPIGSHEDPDGVERGTIVIAADSSANFFNIVAIQDALGEGPSRETLIVTVVRAGYQLHNTPTRPSVAVVEIIDDDLSTTLTATLPGGQFVDGSADETNYTNRGEYALDSWRATVGVPPDSPAAPSEVYFYIDTSSGDQDPFLHPSPVYKNMLKDALNRASGHALNTGDKITYEVDGFTKELAAGGQDPAVPAVYPPAQGWDGFSAPTWVHAAGLLALPHTRWPYWNDPITISTGWYAVVYPFRKADNPHIVPGRWDIENRSVVRTRVIPGDPNTDYLVSLHVSAVCARSVYTGGTLVSSYIYKGGKPANAHDDYVKLSLSDTGTVYYLNAGSTRTAGNIILSYDLDLPIKIRGGTVATLEVNNQDGFQYRAGVYEGATVPVDVVTVQVVFTLVII